MSRKCVVVTGVGRHSLGEAFVRNYAGQRPEVQIIGIDQEHNPDLAQITNLCQMQFDLNPLHRPGSLKGFAPAFAGGLAGVVSGTESTGIECLVQCAGVYDFGRFLEHDVGRRERVLGLNVLGVTEVVYAVMALNDQLGVRNDRGFTHVLLGSFQGLYARGRRPIYAPSKAYGIDLCTSLFDGREVAKCIYIAPGPVDTPMLHRNHWVTKAHGSEEFFEKVLSGPRDKYRSVFMQCDEAALDDPALGCCTTEKAALRVTMTNYRASRSGAYSEDVGVLSAESCAAEMVSRLLTCRSRSGVWMLTSGGAGIVRVKTVAFSKLDRRAMF